MSGEAYEATTDQVRVTVKPSYLPDQSDPTVSRYVWAYEIEVQNLGAVTVQLVSRHWIITDARGRVEEVKGAGVVGEQPILEPGEAFRYTSGCPLTTPSGAMRGTYRMVNDQGQAFDVEIPAFSLDLPGTKRVLN